MLLFWFLIITVVVVVEATDGRSRGEQLIDDVSLNDLEQDDPILIEALKKMIRPPAPKEIPYNFLSPEVEVSGQFGEAEILAKLIGDQKGGFFIEAGAYDGEIHSNTLHFEANRGWTGLLVEPNPDLYSQLLTKNRRAHSLGRCLSTKTKPEIADFDAAGIFGGIINGDRKPGDIGTQQEGFLYDRRTIRIQCYPIYSLILALGNPVVDILSLDIEGAELQVLESIPWDKVDIRFLVIEVGLSGITFDHKIKDFHRLLESKGYMHIQTAGLSQIFVKKDFERLEVVRSFKRYLSNDIQ